MIAERKRRKDVEEDESGEHILQLSLDPPGLDRGGKHHKKKGTGGHKLEQ